MSREDRVRWERRHSGPPCALEPRPSVAGLPRARPGQIALDVASGAGRHSRFLLDAGYEVVATDIAANALAGLRGSLGHGPSSRHLARIHTVQADLDDWPFAAGAFDVIMQSDYLDRRLIDRIRKSLKPGGTVVIDTFLDAGVARTEGPRNPDFLLRPGEFLAWFGDWDIVAHDEGVGGAARGSLLARKPKPPQAGHRID